MFPEVKMTEEEVAKLRTAQGRTIVRGPTGEVVGIFHPSRPVDDFDQNVIERVRQQRGNYGKTHTTAEVLERLKQLEQAEASL